MYSFDNKKNAKPSLLTFWQIFFYFSRQVTNPTEHLYATHYRANLRIHSTNSDTHTTHANAATA